MKTLMRKIPNLTRLLSNKQVKYITEATAPSTSASMKNILEDIFAQKREQLNKIKKDYGEKVVGEITVKNVMNGMQNMYGLVHDTSHLDSKMGITFKGYSLSEIKEFLPQHPEGDEPLPESLIWLFLTGDFPSQTEFEQISLELQKRSFVDPQVMNFIQMLPKNMHPMTQLSACLLYLQKNSEFAKAYKKGISKVAYWEYIYEDAMDIIAKIPIIAAMIYRNLYHNGELINSNPKLDLAANYLHMLGKNDSVEKREGMRAYLTIMSDHEGGNVSQHTTHLVGSALADPYLAYSAGLNGLAGPQHGLGDENFMRWIFDLKAFADKNMRDDDLAFLVKRCYRIIPTVLKTFGAKHPWANVYSYSGVILRFLGITNYEYNGVVMGVSRSIGCMCNLIFARALRFPIERPGSINLQWIQDKFSDEQKALH